MIDAVVGIFEVRLILVNLFIWEFRFPNSDLLVILVVVRAPSKGVFGIDFDSCWIESFDDAFLFEDDVSKSLLTFDRLFGNVG